MTRWRFTWAARSVAGRRHRCRRIPHHAKVILLRFRAPSADKCTAARPRAGGKPILRVGEAQNPGPPDERNRAHWGAFGLQMPHRGAFRSAAAPGFEREEDGDHHGSPREAMGQFALKIVTMNITAWSSCLDFIKTTEADVLLIQEHKLDKEQSEEATAWLRRRRWNSIIAPAEVGPNGGMSAGVAILTRPHIGLGLPLVGTEELVPARMLAARIEAPGCRPLIAIAAYFHDGQGLSRCNLEMLRVAGVFLKAQGEEVPFVMGADFQMEPHEIASAGFAQEVGAAIVATGDASGTCRTGRTARELDFFFVSSGLTDGIEGVGLINHTGIRTHLPVELRFKPRLSSIRALIIRKPPHLGTERIIGPVREVAEWDALEREAGKLADDALDEGIPIAELTTRLGEIVRRWSDEAEKELAEVTVDGNRLPKFGLRGRAPVLVWRSILPEKPEKGGDDDNVRWRNLANAALGLQRLAHDARATRRRTADGIDGRDWTGDQEHEELPSTEYDHDADDLLHCQIGDAIVNIHEIVQQFEEELQDGMEVSEDSGYALASRIRDMLNGISRGGAVSQATMLAIFDLRAIIGRKVDAIAEEVKKRHIDAWREWMCKGIDAGARNAHRYTRSRHCGAPSRSLPQTAS